MDVFGFKFTREISIDKFEFRIFQVHPWSSSNTLLCSSWLLRVLIT